MPQAARGRQEIVGRTFMNLTWAKQRKEWELCVGMAHEGGLDRTSMPELYYAKDYDTLSRKYDEIKARLKKTK